MPASDIHPARFFDVREISSEYRLNCPVHGQVNFTVQFNQDFNRTYCQDCFEVEVAKMSRKVVFNPNGGPLPQAGRVL